MKIAKINRRWNFLVLQYGKGNLFRYLRPGQMMLSCLLLELVAIMFMVVTYGDLWTVYTEFPLISNDEIPGPCPVFFQVKNEHFNVVFPYEWDFHQTFLHKKMICTSSIRYCFKSAKLSLSLLVRNVSVRNDIILHNNVLYMCMLNIHA